MTPQNQLVTALGSVLAIVIVAMMTYTSGWIMMQPSLPRRRVDVYVDPAPDQQDPRTLGKNLCNAITKDTTVRFEVFVPSPSNAYCTELIDGVASCINGGACKALPHKCAYEPVIPHEGRVVLFGLSQLRNASGVYERVPLTTHYIACRTSSWMHHAQDTTLAAENGGNVKIVTTSQTLSEPREL